MTEKNSQQPKIAPRRVPSLWTLLSQLDTTAGVGDFEEFKTTLFEIRSAFTGMIDADPWPSRTCDPEDAPVIDFGTSDAYSVRSLKNRIAEAALADDAAGFRRALLEFQEHWGNLLNIPPPMPCSEETGCPVHGGCT